MLSKRGIWVLIVLFLAFSTLAAPQEKYHLKLLAVQETPNGYEGSDADLYLELKEGTGRVFLETTPLTKLDTQISTRFAKEIACTHFKLNCDQYDFIYTIKAKSSIIGGPSAGAALAALTTLVVLDLDYDERIAITGTINSGGIIGPVGGVKEKLEAASRAGLQKVLIPKGTRNAHSLNQNSSLENTSIDLIAYGTENLSLEVMEAMDLDAVIYELSGVNLNGKEVQITENTQYTRIMAGLQDILCSRMDTITDELKSEKIIPSPEVLTKVKEKQMQRVNASKQGDYYASASFCFTANIQLRSELYTQKKLTSQMVADAINVLMRKMKALDQNIKRQPIETISGLQAEMIVKERMSDVQEQIEKLSPNQSLTLEEKYAVLAYAEERFFSALSWMQFFSMDGKKLVIDSELLQNACQQKISEGEERHQYVSLFIGEHAIPEIIPKIDAAQKASDTGDYELCLIIASQAKAEANAILGSLGLAEEDLPYYVQSKRKAVERVIAENSLEGTFPILGYSYYQYANSLEAKEPASALLYLEYALEMSDLSIYFPEQKPLLDGFRPYRVPKEWAAFGEGILVGVGIVILFWWMKPYLWKKKKRRIR